MKYKHRFTLAGLKKVYTFQHASEILDPQEKKEIRLLILKKISPKYLVLHAALITNGQINLVISGASKSGKSTLAKEFVKKGFKVLANDFIAIWMEKSDLFAGDINYLSVNKNRNKTRIDRIIFLDPNDNRDVFRLNLHDLACLYTETLPEVPISILTRIIRSKLFAHTYKIHICLGNRTTQRKWFFHLNKTLNYHPPVSIGIIGMGIIGQDVANLLIKENWLKQLNLYSPNQEKLSSIILDLKSANPHLNIKQLPSSNQVLKKSDLLIICFNQDQADPVLKAVNERFAKVQTHINIIKQLFNRPDLRNFYGSILVVTNPVDVLSSALTSYLHPLLSSHQVFGVGLGLDYNRLLTINNKLDVVGEHGNNLLLVHNHNGYLTSSSSPKTLAKLLDYSPKIRKFINRTRFGPSHEVIDVIRSFALEDTENIIRVSTKHSHGFLGRHIIPKRGVPEIVYGVDETLSKKLNRIHLEHKKLLEND